MAERGSELLQWGLLAKRSLAPPEEMYTDVPPGPRMFLLGRLTLLLSSEELIKAGFDHDAFEYAREANDVWHRLSNRDRKATQLEQAGETDRAIEIYEACIADMFDGAHPYDRLRTIYIERKQYDEALRVCRRFIEMADVLIVLGSQRSDLLWKRQKFLEWCEKLEAGLEKQSS